MLYTETGKPGFQATGPRSVYVCMAHGLRVILAVLNDKNKTSPEEYPAGYTKKYQHRTNGSKFRFQHPYAKFHWNTTVPTCSPVFGGYFRIAELTHLNYFLLGPLQKESAVTAPGGSSRQVRPGLCPQGACSAAALAATRATSWKQRGQEMAR